MSRPYCNLYGHRAHPRLPARIRQGQRADSLAWSASRRTSSYHLQRDRPLQPILAARASCILRREVQWAEVRTLGRPAGALNHGQDPVPGHTGHGTHKRTRGHTEDTDEPHNHPNPTTHPHDHATAETRNRGRLNSHKNSRRPGVDCSPRPTQKRPPPANRPGKKTPGGAGTHTGHTSAHADTRITQMNLTTHPHDHATAETAVLYRYLDCR